jgi:hypothetical protein
MNKQRNRLTIFVFAMALLFFLVSCSNTGKKKDEKTEKIPEGKTVKVDGMETVKGTNPPKADATTPAKKPSSPAPAPKAERKTEVASAPSRPFSSSALPFFQTGFRRKVAVLDFENKTTYKDEEIGGAVAKKLVDKLEASQRIVPVDQVVVSEMLKKEGFDFKGFTELEAMKRAHQSLGIQAFLLGAVTDVSVLSSKASEGSEEEVAFATSKVEIRLIDASTGNLLRTFIGRSPIFGTKETGEYSRGKAVLRAIDFSLDDILEGLLRQVDLLDWTTTIARIEGENLYVNAGKLSGLRIGDTLEVYEPGKEIIHPNTKISLGWTTGQLKGLIRITDLFGVDAAVGKATQGSGFSLNDVVKTTIR